MSRPEATIGVLAPAGIDRELIRDIIESEGWQPVVPTEGPHPEGPWRTLDVIVVDAGWLERCATAIRRTRQDAGSEFVPVLLVTPEPAAPDSPPELCDDVLAYPTTRAAFATRLGALIQARRESRRVYRTFFENTVVGVYRASLDGTVIMANDALARMLGCEDSTELKSRDAGIPELREARTRAPGALVRELERTGAARAVPGYWVGEGRPKMHVLHSARLVHPPRDIDTDPVVEGTVEDVTVLVEARERLARSERFLQSSIDALSAHVAILDPEGRIVGVNEAWRQFEVSTRPPGSSDIGVDYLEVCARAGDPVALQVAQGIRDVIGGERRVFQVEYPCHSPTLYRWFRLVVTAFPEHPPRRVVVAHEDVTELKKAQRHFQLLIEGSSEFTLVMGEGGTVTYRSPSLAEFTGMDDPEGYRLQELAHPADREAVDGLPASGEATADFRIRRADGAWRDIEWTVTDMRAQPLIHGLVLHGRDVTERKSMLAELQMQEREIRQMQKMEAVGRLAGGVAHDFNNLLTTIKGHLGLAQAARDEGADGVPDEVDEHLSEIARATDQGSFLTRRLLVFSRKEPDAEPILQDLNEVLRGLGKMLRRLIPETIAVEMELEDRPLPVRIRPGEVEQVVVNLTINASDAMKKGGTLSVRTSRVDVIAGDTTRAVPSDLREGAYAVLEVVDTGEGIPDELLEKIFEPFFTTKAKGEGTGLGLATVYGILKRAGGGIIVYSEADLGTCFTSYLPLDPGELPREDTEQRARRVGPEGVETLLLAEDEAPVRTVIRRWLERLGYTVLEAHHGAEALEILGSPEGEDVSLIISDFVMPVMSGLDLARAAHARHPGIPVLITSGYPDSEIDLPADLQWETLSKPYDLFDFATVVRRMIDRANDE